MLRTLILFFAMTLATMSMAADDRYDSLMKAAVGKPSVQILEDAEKAAKQKDERKALVLYMVVCNRSRTATTEQDKTSCALAYLRSGDIYYWRGHYAKALSLYLQGHKICESTEEKRKIIEFYKCFGNVYCMFKDYAQAVKYYERGYELRNLYPDPVITYRLLNNLCHTFYLMGDANNATRYYRLGMAQDRLGQGCDKIKWPQKRWLITRQLHFRLLHFRLLHFRQNRLKNRKTLKEELTCL
ncbi:MAG: tetratricopeptide repeat protein [Prevotella sp.]|nr:tetratricopeptide repeat protein [Prevotella sp.]